MSKRVVIPQYVHTKLTPWYSDNVLRDMRVVRGSLFGAIYGRLGQAAITINGTIHLTRNAENLDSDAGVALLAHELFHMIDQRQQGWWRYMARYFWHWRPRHLKWGESHPLEKDAYARGQEVWKKLTNPGG